MDDRSLRDLLDELDADGRTPGGGSVAALVTSVAAALLAKLARAADDWPDGPGVAAQAWSLRERAIPLAHAAAERYEAALLARATTVGGPSERERRDFAIGQAFAKAAEPPLEIARIATDVTRLAVAVARNGEPKFQADAVAAALVASAAAAAAAELVAVNLTAAANDERVREAQRLADEAARAAAEARAARE
jgi:methenyltetrahydrofolate cyclohydrolase